MAVQLKLPPLALLPLATVTTGAPSSASLSLASTSTALPLLDSTTVMLSPCTTGGVLVTVTVTVPCWQLDGLASSQIS